jgi:putative hydrolase of the HAD superfamily
MQAVVFDAAGTLIRPAAGVAETYASIARNFGVDLPVEVIAERFQESRERIFRRAERCVASDRQERRHWQLLVNSVFREHPDTQPLFEALWAWYARPESWSVYDDVAGVLTQLHQQGVRAVIASNFDRRLTAICEGLPDLAGIRDIFCSAEVGYCKPDVRFYKAIAARLGARPSRMLMIGDDPVNDVQAAIQAGWQARLADRSTGSLGMAVFR